MTNKKQPSLTLLSLFILISINSFGIKKPTGYDPERADSLAHEMLLAINDVAWQNTEVIQWDFMGSREHFWDKKRGLAIVNWKKNEVVFNIDQRKGVAFKNGKAIEGKVLNKKIEKAWKYWVNDSFWLNPISKIFDPGTTRSMVSLKNGQEGLMVSYDSGGNTPGDSFVWILNENNLPIAWRLWVSIIPIGGVKIPWDHWISTETGVKICDLHDTRIIDIKLSNVKTAFKLEEISPSVDPFSVLYN